MEEAGLTAFRKQLQVDTHVQLIGEAALKHREALKEQKRVSTWTRPQRAGVRGHREELLSLLTQSSWLLVSPLAAPLQVRRFFLR